MEEVLNRQIGFNEWKSFLASPLCSSVFKPNLCCREELRIHLFIFFNKILMDSSPYLHAFFFQMSALCQLLPGVHIWILVLQKQLLQGVQLLLGEDGAVTSGSPLHLTRRLLLLLSFPQPALLREHRWTPSVRASCQSERFRGKILQAVCAESVWYLHEWDQRGGCLHSGSSSSSSTDTPPQPGLQTDTSPSVQESPLHIPASPLNY